MQTSEYCITSPQSSVPNCIGWAMGDRSQFWEPGPPTRGYYWPPDVPQDDSLDSWIRVFELHGYRACESTALEPSIEKIAIYLGIDGLPSHVARQKATGTWTSKLGKLEDIQHDTLEALEGDEYGEVAQIMRRQRQGQGVILG